jgi:hypothetical protein
MRSTIMLWAAIAAIHALAACSEPPEDAIRERLQRQMKDAGRGASDAEREQVADALAEDLLGVGEQAGAVAAAQEEAARDIEARHGTPGEAIAEECRSLQASIQRLEQLQREPSAGHDLAAAELAALPDELARIRERRNELCRS